MPTMVRLARWNARGQGEILKQRSCRRLPCTNGARLSPVITLRSLTDIDFVAAAAAALLGVLLIMVPGLAPLAALLAPEICFSFASAAAVRWALRQPAALPPAPPAALPSGLELSPGAA